MNTLTLNYNGLPLQANREAWFNATEIAAMFGKRPIDWLRLPETERYIAALCKREAEKQQIAEVRKSHFIKTRKGGNDLTQQGTWLHPKLAVAFARWCDIDFALWCDEQIETLIREGKDHQSSRQESSIAYRIMGEILQAARKAEGKDTQPHHYRNEALLCNAALTGQFTAIARDSLDKPALNMLTRLQAHNAALIGQGIPYPKRKNILFKLAAHHRPRHLNPAKQN